MIWPSSSLETFVSFDHELKLGLAREGGSSRKKKKLAELLYVCGCGWHNTLKTSRSPKFLTSFPPWAFAEFVMVLEIGELVYRLLKF